MKRTWGLSVLVCPKCTGPMRLIAAIEDSPTAGRILNHLGLAARPPPGSRPLRPQPGGAIEQRADEFEGIDAPAFAD